jgi:hypothetical protein
MSAEQTFGPKNMTLHEIAEEFYRWGVADAQDKARGKQLLSEADVPMLSSREELTVGGISLADVRNAVWESRR